MWPRICCHIFAGGWETEAVVCHTLELDNPRVHRKDPLSDGVLPTFRDAEPCWSPQGLFFFPIDDNTQLQRLKRSSNVPADERLNLQSPTNHYAIKKGKSLACEPTLTVWRTPSWRAVESPSRAPWTGRLYLTGWSADTAESPVTWESEVCILEVDLQWHVPFPDWPYNWSLHHHLEESMSYVMVESQEIYKQPPSACHLLQQK